MNLISHRDAVEAIGAACSPGREESIPTDQALGAVPSRPVISVIDSPAFNNAAMDGFAVRAENTISATPNCPIELPILGELKVGAVAEVPSPPPRCAMHVATGALTPQSLDAVVSLEQAALARRGGAVVLRLFKPVKKGQNLRIAGEEYEAGAQFDFIGERLNSGHIALFSAAGVTELIARRPPALALVTTGNEIRPPGAPLAPGETTNVNASWLDAWCQERRLPVVARSHVGDDAGALGREFRIAREAGARVLISSGSASAGRHDVLREALQAQGARIVFHGVAMRPGKPALFALLRDGTPVFGLPGNPLATAAGMRFLVWAGISAIMGMGPEEASQARLADACDLRKGLAHFLLAHCDSEAGPLRLVQPQRPGQAGALAAADCWVGLDVGRSESGALVNCYSL